MISVGWKRKMNSGLMSCYSVHPPWYSSLHRLCVTTLASSEYSCCCLLCFLRRVLTFPVISDLASPSCPAVISFPPFPSHAHPRTHTHLFPIVLFSLAIYIPAHFHSVLPDSQVCICCSFPAFVLPVWCCLPDPGIDDFLPDPLQDKFAWSDCLPSFDLACYLIQANVNFYLNLSVCESCFGFSYDLWPSLGPTMLNIVNLTRTTGAALQNQS